MTRASTTYSRDADNWYVEPMRCTRELLTAERFDGVTLDPCCGQGNIVEALREYGYEAFGCDIVDRCSSAEWFLGFNDFRSNEPMNPNNIVFNPPYQRGRNGTEFFIRRAVELAEDKVAAFLEVGFLAGEKRGIGLYRELPPDRIYIHSDRPSCPPGEFLLDGGTADGGTKDFMWLVWDKTLPQAERGQARTMWLAPEK